MFSGVKLRKRGTRTLVEGNDVITNDGKLAQIFHEYFVNIAPSLGITSLCENNDDVNNDNMIIQS